MNGSYGFKLLCFKPESQLKWRDFVRSCHFIYPEESLIKGSRSLFAALLQKCNERKVVAICSFKPREVSSPTFVALEPQLEVKDDNDKSQKTPPGFRVFYLPFSDDFRDLPEPLELHEPEVEQVEAATKIIKKLKMKNYEVEQFENPALQSHYKMIESLALFTKDAEDENVDDTMPDLEFQAQRLGSRSQEFLKAVQPSAQVKNAIAERFSNSSANKRPYNAASIQNGTKRAKKEPEIAIDTSSMENLVNLKKVESLKVEELKAFLKSVGGVVTGKKKNQLVAEIYDHFII